ncbi:B12-binding domain-containing radical SAM protein [Patescibacteria group bacterium]|nr:B12-binding domain-containing radical SAM protein [Patescibacteria group bacterium]
MLRYKKILLINPPGTQQYGYTPAPLGLLYLASYLERKLPQIKIEIIDGALIGETTTIKKIKQFPPDLVCISVLTPSRHMAIKITKIIKKKYPKTKVVFGSAHPSLMWQQMMSHYPQIDYVIRGEGEISLLKLVKGVKLKNINGLVWRNKSNQIINNPNQKLVSDLNQLPFPAWHLVDAQKYPPRGEGIINNINLKKEIRFPLIFSRGCMGACTFCSSWKIWRGYRFRSGKNVADEVEMMVKTQKAKHFVFQDDTLTGNKNEIINFCQEIIKRKLNVALSGCTRVDCVDKEILSWMKKAGFYYLSYGIESGSPKMLKKINKKTDLKKIRKAAFLTKKAGIQLGALIMYGLPQETKKDKLLTEKLLKDIKPDDLGSIGQVWLFPGTFIYQQAIRAGLITDKFWLGPEPYYIYRGGIGKDPFDWKLRLSDMKKYYPQKTLKQKIIFLTAISRQKQLLKKMCQQYLPLPRRKNII